MNQPNYMSLSSMLDQMKNNEDINKVNQILEIEKLPKEEKHKLFKDQLRKAGVTATWKWEDAERVLYNEPIWKSIKTFQEKRSLFNDFVRQCKLKEREDIKLRKEKLKVKFRQMLEEDSSLNSNSKFSEALTKYCYDDRWRAIDEREREEIFQDYIDILFKKEEDEWRQTREKQKKQFERSLEDKHVKVKMKWKEICQLYSNDPLFISMEKIDQIETFSNYITRLENIEKQRKEEEDKYLAYQNREKFRDLLQYYLDQNKITIKTKWNTFVKEIKDKEEYLNLLGQPGSTPHDFFNDVIMALRDEYKQNRKILKKILKENTIKFSANISYEAYTDILAQYKEYSDIKNELKPILYEYLVEKLKEKEIEHNRREVKIANKLYSYIQRKKLSIGIDMEFEEALPLIKQHKKFVPISDENLRFAYVMLQEMMRNKPIEFTEGKIDYKNIMNEEEKEDGETSN